MLIAKLPKIPIEVAKRVEKRQAPHVIRQLTMKVDVVQHERFRCLYEFEYNGRKSNYRTKRHGGHKLGPIAPLPIVQTDENGPESKWNQE